MGASTRSWVWAWVLGLVACTGEEVSSPEDAGRPPPAVHLRQVSGQVTLERNGQSSPAAVGALLPQDTLETGGDGAAEVVFPGDRVVSMGPDSRFTVDEDAFGLVLRINRGSVATAAGGSSVAMSILTPFGLTRLGSDASQVSVAVEGDEAKVDVAVGQVEMVSRNGVVVAQAGQVLLLSRSQEPMVMEAGMLELAPLTVVIHPNGKAELKASGSSKWTRVARAGARLQAGDTVRVVQGESGLLVGDSSQLTLAAGGEVRLDQAEGNGSNQRLKLSLQRGALRLSLGEVPTQLVLPELEIHSSRGGGQLTARRVGNEVEVAALTGSYQLHHPTGNTTLPAGSSAWVEGAGVRVSEGRPHALVLPMMRGIRVAHPGLSQASLAWPGEGKPVRIKVSNAANLSKPILAGTISQGWINVPIPARGQLYWEVTPLEGGAQLQGSASFGPEVAARQLGHINNRVPESAQRTTIYFQDKPPAVTFTYTPQSGAARYRLKVYGANALTVPVLERESRGNFVTIEAGRLKEGSYVWSATPLSSTGQELRGGAMNKLDIVYDNVVPTLVVTAPANGAPTGESVQVSGTAPVGSRLRVNGQPVPLDGKSRFRAQVKPSGEPPLMLFHLSPPRGPDQFTVRRLRSK